MDVEFDAGYGIAEGEQFTLWTKDWVYESSDYDGADYIIALPRNPPTS